MLLRALYIIMSEPRIQSGIFRNAWVSHALHYQEISCFVFSMSETSRYLHSSKVGLV